MNRANPGNDSDTAAIFPARRRRGHRQNYPSLIDGENSRVLTVQSHHPGENTSVPPGFGGVNGHHPNPVQPSVDPNDDMVAQVVSGVIEAAFDAGYLINVRVGNSETFLRGVVFMSGRYVPVSAENDVAPDVELIRRTEIPLPKENYAQAQSSRESNEHHVNSHRNGTAGPVNHLQTNNLVPTNLVVNKGKQVQSVAAHPLIARCDPAPATLHPLHFSNGAPIPNRPSPVVAADMASSKRKRVQMVVEGDNPSNSRTSNLVPPIGNQVLASQEYTTLQLMPQSLQAHGVHDAEAKSMRQRSVPMEKGPSLSTPTHTDRSNKAKMGVNDCGCILDDEVCNINQPLTVEPLQSVQPHQLNPSASVHNRTGNMNELQQVKMENQDEQ